MDNPRYTARRRPSAPRRPLNRARLEEMALAYVARYATSAARLERYLARKLRERGWDDTGEPDLAGLVGRYAERGYVDDAGYARQRASGLLRRGYGPRRVAQALGAAGIAEELREAARPGEGEARRAAFTYAQKRGFGPFGPAAADRAIREKQIAAMLRAGHGIEDARALIDAPSVAEAQAWAEEEAG